MICATNMSIDLILPYVINGNQTGMCIKFGLFYNIEVPRLKKV